MAALGLLDGASPIFTPSNDVKHGGILFSLPSLLSNGLLEFSNKHFTIPCGYYHMHSIFLTLAFCALLRIKSLEQVRYCDVGEIGKSLGLDRIPEVKTLREKIKHMATTGDVDAWEKELSSYWMKEDTNAAGTLYIDGHVRVYRGSKTKLPKRFVSREKLCLRGVTDYWVNDATGRPFFVINKVINEGMLATIKKEIVPRLLIDVPNQPLEEEINKSKFLKRFSIIFDREGYSIEFFKEMWASRIACYTYKKNVKDVWPSFEFKEVNVKFPNGEMTSMKLAERGVYFKKEKIWLREIRKLSDSGHQTVIVTTDYQSTAEDIAAHMFSRWSQENYFKYMMQHFEIDKLIGYQLENIDETIYVINPEYRKIESSIRSKASKLARAKVKYIDLIFKEDIEKKEAKKFIDKKSKLKDRVDSLSIEVKDLKEKKKLLPRKITIKDLPNEEKFKQFKRSDKLLVDCIKMISYRAETAMANYLKKFMLKGDESRNLIRQILLSDADFMPDLEDRKLYVKLHNLTSFRNSKYAQELCDLLTSTETCFPGTDLKIVYNLVSD